MKHAVKLCCRGEGIHKQSIRRQWCALFCEQQSGFCLWKSLQLFFWNMTHYCNSVFITYKWFPRPPASYSLLACWTQYKLHSSKEIIQVYDRTSVMYRCLKRCFWEFGRESKAGRSNISTTNIHNKAFTHWLQFSHMNVDADIHMHTPIYMHSLDFSHATLSRWQSKTVSTLK